ncbi:acyl-CoA thioesterase [Legionella brunensis]|uniref:Acyl-CoA thioesterase n=1 Tax=Legionella brunensis TaxID=29422 RepID=A0A0W0SUN8_9GAMM|nr:thioesterase family protein [Legionella brunensis]KTC86661.1 acyl-CoA thioesterase [Legionella brunensis]
MICFTWNSEVRAHEIDAQGIVNNAHYLSYFDHARTLLLREYGIDWVKLSHDGFNLVLAHADIRFLHSLRAFQTFRVISTARREGKIKLLFDQTIVCTNNEKLICTAVNTIVCVDSKRNKPVSLELIKQFELMG